MHTPLAVPADFFDLQPTVSVLSDEGGVVTFVAEGYEPVDKAAAVQKIIEAFRGTCRVVPIAGCVVRFFFSRYTAGDRADRATLVRTIKRRLDWAIAEADVNSIPVR